MTATSTGRETPDQPDRRRRPQAALALFDSVGFYRVPYADGTVVQVGNDHLSHDPPGRIDLNGLGHGPFRVVAAADGLVCIIVDKYDENRPDQSPCRNNYVWIQHDNGEWTKYSHLRQDSVTDESGAGLRVGDRVTSGQLLGIEGDVGCAHGEHLHFEVAVPDDPTQPLANKDTGAIDGSNFIPRVCHSSVSRYVEDAKVVAGPCPPVRVQALRFDRVEIGTSVTRECRISSLRDEEDVRVRVTGSPGGSVFAWSPLSGTMGPGGAIDVAVTFTPVTLLPAQATLNLVANGPDPVRPSRQWAPGRLPTTAACAAGTARPGRPALRLGSSRAFSHDDGLDHQHVGRPRRGEGQRRTNRPADPLAGSVNDTGARCHRDTAGDLPPDSLRPRGGDDGGGGPAGRAAAGSGRNRSRLAHPMTSS